MPLRCRERIVERGVGAAAVEEAVLRRVAVSIGPDDLARVLMPKASVPLCRRIVERGVGAAAVEEAVGSRRCNAEVRPDDLAVVVDANRLRCLGAERIVERGVGAAAVEEAVWDGAAAVQVSTRRSGPRC